MSTESLVIFEYTPTATAHKPHSLLFIGGLGDGLATTSYMADLVRALQPTDYSIFTLNLTSSYQSWGLGHLDRDTDEIAQCVRYIKENKNEKFGPGKMVLMGHSTGRQCVLHYLYRDNPHVLAPAFDRDLEHVQRLAIDGAIMQAPVSDREAIQWVLKWGIGDRSPEQCPEVYQKMEAFARDAAPRDEVSGFDTLLPLELTSTIYPSSTAISCRRFLSLVSPESSQAPREDDLFSSDLSDEQLEKTFGMVQRQGLLKGRLAVLISGADQSIPDWVNKDNLLSRWKKATDSEGPAIWDQEHSGIIPNASHALSNDDQAVPREFLVGKVMGFLQLGTSKGGN
ncbi:hypothetical protein SI65_01686 [Aspergillus cristatus]|uniref:Uncharacterized protein n=1 Tax=Aspergillus cristatus TaxID=573508 RepID=A0A1E3BUR8_ASPCR|nr:hypothetical protein SI65_01686 [Aspergillus cristatus]